MVQVIDILYSILCECVEVIDVHFNCKTRLILMDLDNYCWNLTVDKKKLYSTLFTNVCFAVVGQDKDIHTSIAEP